MMKSLQLIAILFLFSIPTAIASSLIKPMHCGNLVITHDSIPQTSKADNTLQRLLHVGDSCLLRYNTFVALKAYQEAEAISKEPYVLRKLAECEYERGIYSSCLSTLHKIPVDSISHNDMRMQYQCLHNIGERDSAHVLCKNILDRYPYDAQMTVNMATHYNQKEELDSALLFTSKFRETDAFNAIVNQQHAFLLYQKGDFTEALTLYRQLHAMKAENASICYYMGLCYDRCDSVFCAVDKLQQAAQMENYTNPHVLSYLGTLMVQIGRYKDAAEYLNKSLELLKPSDKQLFMIEEGLSNANFYLADYKESIVHLRECLKYNPDHIYTYFKLGQAYGFLKNKKREREAYRTFVERAEKKQAVRQSLRNLIEDAKVRIRQINEEEFFKGNK